MEPIKLTGGFPHSVHQEIDENKEIIFVELSRELVVANTCGTLESNWTWARVLDRLQQRIDNLSLLLHQ